jgi:hypothetical protein
MLPQVHTNLNGVSWNSAVSECGQYGLENDQQRFEFTTLVVIGTDCIGSCKSNYHMTTTMTALLEERYITCIKK